MVTTRNSVLLLLLAVVAATAGCSREDEAEYAPSFVASLPRAEPVRRYIMAVHPLHNPRRLFEVYQPLIELINEASNPDFSIKLETSRDYAAFEAKLQSGKFHFALPNPYQAVESERRGYRIFGKMGNDERFRGIIVVRRNGGPSTVAGLRGESISFPAPTALAATMMPKLFLNRAGLATGEINARYVGSQESAIMNVLLGNTVAAGTWPPPWEALLRQRPELADALVVQWRTEPLVNNGLVVRRDVPDGDIRKVAEIVFSLHEHGRGRGILNAMEIERFEPADTTSFEPVRNFMRDYRAAFGELP